MSRVRILTLFSALILSALRLLPAAGLGAQTVTSVTISPSVVPVPLSATRQTSVLVTAAVSGLAAGGTVACVGTLSAVPSGTTLLTSSPVNTSPASTSGSTSVSIQFLLPGGTAPGAAQASVNCNGATATANFRISSLVGISVSPTTVPAGGVVTLTTMIAAAGALAATPCTLTLTDPSGSAPPLLTQTLSVSGGTLTTPASTALTLTLPNAAALGTANVAVSCVISGSGTSGDAMDFTVTDPTVVTILGFTTPAVVGTPLSVTSITLPGFSCVALFTPPTGLRISSSPALADLTGTAVNVIALTAGLQTGTGALGVTCTDPNNQANSASSAAQVVTLVSAATLTASATLTYAVPPLVGGSLLIVTVGSSPGASCTLGGVSAGGVRFPITEASAAGTVPASGSLPLSFHLPSGLTEGSAVLIANCTTGGVSASAQVTALLGVSQGEQNCDAGTAPAAAQTSPMAGAGAGYAGSAGSPVQFQGSAVPSMNAVLTSCVWTFGDGDRATTMSPTHVYAAPGTYTATLQITDSAGLSASAAAPVTIANFVPQCSLPAPTGAAALGPCAGVSVCPTISQPGGCLPLCTSATAPDALCPQPGVSVSLTTDGPYQAAVSQSISFHAMAEVSATRRVCSEDTTLGLGGPVCSVVPSDDAPSPVSYLWDFGDGSQATGSTTAHAYGQPGSYAVTVTVFLDDGSSATTATSATITAAAPG